ncbi:MAG: hypothetical protein ACKV2V_02090 [Blastocatellia bacterium]
MASLYVLALIYFGDCLCRRFYRFSSVPHRLATGFLVGLLPGSWITYLGAVCFAWTGHALLSGNLVFLAVVMLAWRFLSPRRTPDGLDAPLPRPPGTDRYDWFCLGAVFIFGMWLMMATLHFRDGNFEFGFIAVFRWT